MKRTLLIASIIGLFMFTAMDLQAYHRKNDLPEIIHDGIALLSQITAHHHRGSYAQYDHHQGRKIVREIRRNEKRIRKLEKRIYKLDRHYGSYREIRELEQEINWLERRNDYLRHQLY